MSLFYLDGTRPVFTDDVVLWAAWYQSADRRVAEDLLTIENVKVRVSTVALGMSMGTGLNFETMVFDGEHDGYLQRSETWEDAEDLHANVVKNLKNGAFKDLYEYDDESDDDVDAESDIRG